jgi:6-phosphogluconolactonase
MNRLCTFETAREAAEACGAAIFAILEQARAATGLATLAVSGGSTPRIMFEWMAKQGFDWKSVELFWVDERCVAIDDSQSNFRMTREAMLDTLQLPAAQVHRVLTENAPDQAARLYVEEIRRIFGLAPGQLPAFDVLQRGMGPDMHTASLFPGEPLIANHSDIAAAVWVEKFKQHRVTLLPGALEAAKNTFCLVTGPDKTEALKAVLEGPRDPMVAPCQISSPEMVWFLDRPAAANISH